tara:strand:- start:30 stop:164 length:135 start_codon:yes stop_codon:yes gene_type:complete
MDYQRLENAEAQEDFQKEEGTFNKGDGTQEVPTDENGEEIELPF